MFADLNLWYVFIYLCQLGPDRKHIDIFRLWVRNDSINSGFDCQIIGLSSIQKTHNCPVYKRVIISGPANEQRKSQLVRYIACVILFCQVYPLVILFMTNVTIIRLGLANMWLSVMKRSMRHCLGNYAIHGCFLLKFVCFLSISDNSMWKSNNIWNSNKERHGGFVLSIIHKLVLHKCKYGKSPLHGNSPSYVSEVTRRLSFLIHRVAFWNTKTIKTRGKRIRAKLFYITLIRVNVKLRT